jgi:signal peptidase II
VADRPHEGEDDAVSDQPRPASRPRRSHARLLLGLAAGVLVLDLVTKLVVVATLSDREPVRLLGGLVHLTEARNTGAAFSFAEGATVVFTLIAVAVAVVIIRSARRLHSAGWAVALALVLGGAVGNLVDRVFRDPGFLRGGVVDFIQIGWWPIFNVADSAIVCGGVLGALLAFRGVEFDGSHGRDRSADGATVVD